MGTNGLKKVLATLLAASMLAPSAAALAEKKGKATSTKPATTVEEQVVAPSIEELCLSEEYIAFLNQNNIQIVDGNIVVETAEQFNLIAQYYLDYLKSNGVETNLKDVCDHILGLNHAFISDDVKKELLEKNMITYPLINYEKTEGLYKALCDHLKELSKKGTSKDFCSNTYIMFDYKIRKCIALEENYYITFLDTQKVGKKDKNPQYIVNFLDFYHFLIGEESNFPYKMSDLDKSSLCIFLLINVCEQTSAAYNSKPPLVEIMNYNADSKLYEKFFEIMNSYINNFPVEDEKIAALGK